MQALLNGTSLSIMFQNGTNLVFKLTGSGPLGGDSWQFQQIVDPYGQVYQVSMINVGGSNDETDEVITEPGGRWIKIRSWWTYEMVQGANSEMWAHKKSMLVTEKR